MERDGEVVRVYGEKLGVVLNLRAIRGQIKVINR